MFNAVNNSSSEGTREVDDIFSDIDSSPTTNQNLNNSGASSTTQQPTEAQMQARAQAQTFSSEGRGNYSNSEDSMPAAGSRSVKILKISLILLIVVGVVIVAGYFVYTKFIQSPQINEIANVVPVVVNEDAAALAEKIAEQENNNLEAPIELETPVNGFDENINNPVIDDLIDSGVPAIDVFIDTDGDGLGDQEELLMGTDINMVDTDGDGLSDYEEVKVYFTNPLNADSDGDGHSDGLEVQNGFNPNGPGKLSSSTATVVSNEIN